MARNQGNKCVSTMYKTGQVGWEKVNLHGKCGSLWGNRRYIGKVGNGRTHHVIGNKGRW